LVLNGKINYSKGKMVELCLGWGVASGTMTKTAGYSLEVIDANI
jgi:hypothetical protein